MKSYKVTWEIEVDAKSYKGAAKEALKIQRASSSSATVFKIREFGKKKEVLIDLDSMDSLWNEA